MPATLAGCAAPGGQPPSLAPRAAEAIDPRVPVPEQQPSTAVDPALSAQLAALIARAEAGDAEFRAAAAGAQQAAEAAGPARSESWVAAQQALSALVATRGPVTLALGDVDSLGSRRIQQLGGIAAADMRAIQSRGGARRRIDRRQVAVIERLEARLR